MNNNSCDKSKSNNKAPEWDLSDLYKGLDDPKIESDITYILGLKTSFCEKYTDKICEIQSSGQFLKAVQEYEAICESLSKITCFAYLNKAKNSSDETTSVFYQNVIDKLAPIESQIIFFTLERNA